jgi:hypothetical protein
MSLGIGAPVRFKPRPVEGAPTEAEQIAPQFLLLASDEEASPTGLTRDAHKLETLSGARTSRQDATAGSLHCSFANRSSKLV